MLPLASSALALDRAPWRTPTPMWRTVAIPTTRNRAGWRPAQGEGVAGRQAEPRGHARADRRLGRCRWQIEITGLCRLSDHAGRPTAPRPGRQLTCQAGSADLAHDNRCLVRCCLSSIQRLGNDPCPRGVLQLRGPLQRLLLGGSQNLVYRRVRSREQEFNPVHLGQRRVPRLHSFEILRSDADELFSPVQQPPRPLQPLRHP
jgi:hypothetical protein